VKKGDAWNPKVEGKPEGPSATQQQVCIAPPQGAVSGFAANASGTGNSGVKHVLRHVEVKRGMSVGEAEKRMEEMCKELLRFQNGDVEKDEKDEKNEKRNDNGNTEEIIQN
jgi:hypothetical protein